ncbi:MAG TPA: ATP-grasp domain-containing protein [Methylomirabilota bacterium]|nr:ATP-grasp domain-containing protein [Methylomirabilota bacterium]
MGLSIALCYDSKEEYLAAGHSTLEVAEFDDEGVIAGLESALGRLGHRVERVGRGRSLAARLVAGDRWDLVFNVAEGLRGRAREAQVPALCELFDQPYSFSDPVVCGLTLDKALAKRVVRDAGLPTPAFAVIRTLADAAEVGLDGRLFVKPLAEGSSKGIGAASIVEHRDRLPAVCATLLADFPSGVLVEEMLPGREVTVGVVGNGTERRVVAVMEVVWTEHSEVEAYTQLNKDEYLDRLEYRLVDGEPLAVEAARLALAVAEALECRDAARVDLRCDANGRLSFLEVNPLPGLHPVRSDLPIMARLAGLAYDDLLAAIVDAAHERTLPRPCAPSWLPTTPLQPPTTLPPETSSTRSAS